MARRANGEGSIYQRPNGRWEAMASYRTPEGGSKRKKFTGRTQAEVRRQLGEFQAKVAAGVVAHDTTTKVEDFVDDYLLHRVTHAELSPKTKASYSDLVHRYIVPLWGGRRLARLTPRDIETGLITLAERGLARDTVRLVKSSMSRLCAYAVDLQLIAVNPVERAKLPQAKPPRTRRAMTVHQVETLLEHLEGTRLQTPFLVAVTTGLRPGELLALTWSQVNLGVAPATIRILRSKTDAGRRTVGLIPRVADALRRHREQQDLQKAFLGDAWSENDLVFPSEIGTAWDQDNHRRAFRKACADAGIGHWSPHELRHSCATLLMETGTPIQHVSYLLGHSSISITADVYGHLSGPTREVLTALSDLFGGNDEPLASEPS